MPIEQNFPDLLELNRQLTEQHGYLNVVMNANAPYGVGHFRDPQGAENQILIKDKEELRVGDYAYAGNAIGYVSEISTSGEAPDTTVDSVGITFTNKHIPTGVDPSTLEATDLKRVITVSFGEDGASGEDVKHQEVDTLTGAQVVFMKNSAIAD